MRRWRCPDCGREFERARQSHTCIPGNTVEQTFAHRPEQRAIYDRLMKTLSGPMHVDAVSVGVFLKRRRKFAEIRPKATHVLLWLFLPVRIEHEKIASTISLSVDRTAHRLKLVSAKDVDANVKKWLKLAYAAAG